MQSSSILPTKRMKYHFLLLTLFLSSCPALVAQSKKLEKANSLYTSGAYADAIPLYEKELKKDSTSRFLLSNLGDCYRMTSNAPGQVRCYGNLVRHSKAELVQEYYYGQALAAIGKAEQAKPYLDKYATNQKAHELAAKSFSKNADAYSMLPAAYNSKENDFCAVMFMDVIVFTSGRSKPFWASKSEEGGDDRYVHLYTTQKSAKGRYLKPKLFMRDLTTRYNDGPVCFNKEFTKVYFSRNYFKKSARSKDGSYKLRLFEARLNSSGFDTVAQFPFNNNEYNLVHPSLSADGSALYFASDMPGGKGGMDLYVSRRVNGQWAQPVSLGDKINTEGDELFPFINGNGLLYFSSDGHNGMGGLDIYEAKLKDDKGLRIYNMGEPVNSKYDDFGYYLMTDNKTGFVSSNRKSGGEDDDVYHLLVLREVKRGKEGTLLVKNKATGEVLPGAKIIINADTLTAGEKGEYTTLFDEDADYALQAGKEDYFKTEAQISTKTIAEDSFVKELLLEKDPKLVLVATVKDARTNVLLEGVSIKIREQNGNRLVDSTLTGLEGNYSKKLSSHRLGDQLHYLITVEKAGYLAKTATYDHTITTPGEVNISERVNLSLGKVEVGMDLAKMIEIKPIYFDLGKSVIRPDAATELDKVVAIMNEYPNMSIELGSHSDCRGAAPANLKLSTARAKASAAYIVKKGINKSRIVGKGYGESKLLNNCACEGKKVVSNCAEEEHTKNRRTEFLITRLQ